MTVLVAVTDTSEGSHALLAGKKEAAMLDTDLLVVNLSLTEPEEVHTLADDGVTVLDRIGRGDRDPATAVLDLIDDRPDIERLVIGVKRRSAVGKALLGSVSQRLILQSPIPVLAVKTPQ
ncbi:MULTISPECIES: universal stress protein [Rhodococcus]|uniref:Possible universal stress protein n=2 Tax=Rhodococcus TaxID=1827 RepID=A0A402C7D2_RHOWR|nr:MULTISPECIES: universal stress protein [Rhodococcus]KAF0963577.1 Universal stress protein [Rhodococcus sp. T7]MBV6758017.1 universal stress protein [Rhodococcus opacus]MDF3309145.1 universal stress protein [Rhodococcus sp. T2V]QSE91417.1 universal stress protein [Rhodococcus pseudokoreensis]QYB01186.1 universal stress protein [Rhodococcus sp. USK10]